VVRVESSRGAVEATARCTGNRPGTLFLPFHYGGEGTAANDLTPTSWDPVSKQPQFKSGAARVVLAAEPSIRAAAAGAASHNASPEGD
jgi:ferredoxin-nitrate reductase